ncbi:hypothetical protein PR048_028419 [Dryococelus australis]|uniref:Transposase n=1 Tax=Dryococelus australis TaxID=614101 RepID=A0ABQ9GEA5_9NEOP|nr:hypothetical protein PR048_028419 [Dryococelus australis]
MNSEVYQDIVTQFIALLDVDECDCWFQQDGATCHTSNATMQLLHEFFGYSLISAGLWPTRSPDLWPRDFFLWRYFKTNVYKNYLHTIEDLKRYIKTEINKISVLVLQKVTTNMVKRARICITEGGSHIEHML